MEFDVTFHPITSAEFRRYFLDVIAEPGLAGERASEITTEQDKIEAILDMYKKLAGWKDQQESFSSTFSFGLAVIAGYLHPYWYARNACVSFLIQQDETVEVFERFPVSLVELAPEVFKGIVDDECGLLSSNYSASGLIDNSKLQELRECLLGPGTRKSVGEVFNEASLRALDHAIEYSMLNDCSLLEASDLVVPFSEECSSDRDNLRAEFLGNDSEYEPSRRITMA